MSEPNPRVLFVCRQNAGRSQMAAALFNHHSRGRAHADSAGTRPASRVHREVVEVMRELGIDLEGVKPRQLRADDADGSAQVVTMGCDDSECPVFRVPVEDWGLADPAGRPVEEVRAIRDEIDRRVLELINRLDR